MVIIMKKIFAILVSLLFVVSVFGVALMSAISECSITASPTTVRVGENITVVSSSSTVTVTGTGSVTKISGPTLDNGNYVTVYRAITAGEAKFTLAGGCNKTVVILSKDLPFKFFAKLFGFGNTD
jgi:hypothetical protein